MKTVILNNHDVFGILCIKDYSEKIIAKDGLVLFLYSFTANNRYLVPPLVLHGLSRMALGRVR